MKEERKRRADALRILASDMVEAAQSGHPGAPLGMADVLEVLFTGVLKFDPKHPEMRNRDRFILSNGHASAGLYAALHLSGYDLPMGELRRFRQIHSRAPGHPEPHLTPGVEVATGPLGQGLAMGVGMALSERLLSESYNQEGHTLFDHKTYVFVGDGCLMEGISHEAASLAGVLKLDKLVVLYDANGISIDGPIDRWMNEDMKQRFESYHFEVFGPVDGHNTEAIEAVFRQVQESRIQKPKLVIFNTKIGLGAGKVEGTAEAHGNPLGEECAAQLRAALRWDCKPFEIPREIYDSWSQLERGQRLYEETEASFESYAQAFPKKALELESRLEGKTSKEVLAYFERKLKEAAALSPKKEATRRASHQLIEELAPIVPGFFGGSADLTPSTLTSWKSARSDPFSPRMNYLSFGVREFGMYAILLGMSAYGGFMPFGGTFLAFLDYAKAALRLSALMKKQVVFILTHDSVGLGEDGPTHQPVEQLAMLRSTPEVDTWRPCDLLETTAAWQKALCNTQEPTALVLTRQNILYPSHEPHHAQEVKKGGYILQDAENPELLVLSSGSEVPLCLAAIQTLKPRRIRLISIPSHSSLRRQDKAYLESLFPKGVPAVAVEASSDASWYEWMTERRCAFYGLQSFGLSGKGEDLFAHFGFTPEALSRFFLDFLSEAR